MPATVMFVTGEEAPLKVVEFHLKSAPVPTASSLALAGDDHYRLAGIGGAPTAEFSSDSFSAFSSVCEPRTVDVDQDDLAKGPQPWTPTQSTVSSARYNNRLTKPRH